MTTQDNLLQNALRKIYKEYKEYKEYIKILEEENIKPVLEELWYLRIPAFTAILSFIFFAGIAQTLEVYRVFALNPRAIDGGIVYSFVSIFLLSLNIWYSGRALSIQRGKEHEKATTHEDSPRDLQDQFLSPTQETSGDLEPRSHHHSTPEKVTHRDAALKWLPRLFGLILKPLNRDAALKWLPRLFGLVPLIGLGFGLFFAFFAWSPKSEDTLYAILNLWIGILICIILGCIYWLIVINLSKLSSRRVTLLRNLGDRTGSEGLFRPSSVANTAYSSTIVFFIFTLPLVTNELVRLIACLTIVTILPIIWYFSQRFSRNRVLNCFALFLLTIALLSVAFRYHPATFPSLLGSVSIIAIFLSIFVFLGSLASLCWGYLRIPIITLLVILSFVFSSSMLRTILGSDSAVGQ